MLYRLLLLLCLSLFITGCSWATGGGNYTYVPHTDYGGYGSFSEASTEVAVAGVTEDTTLLFSGTAVEQNYRATLTRSDATTPFLDENKEISDGVTVSNESIVINRNLVPTLRITLDKDDGTIASASIYTENRYRMDSIEGATDLTATGTITNAPDSTKDGSILTVSREFDTGSGDDYNFVSQYMMSAYWEIKTNAPDSDSADLTGRLISDKGYMIAGFETASADIVKTGNATFKGSGRGYQKYSEGSRDTNFDVTAIVDFARSNVDFSTNNTKYCSHYDNNNSCDGYTDISKLNIASTILEQRRGKNIYIGYVNVDGMKGSVHARFYGLDNNAANELGGTFIVGGEATNGNEYDAYYYGAFGAKK